MEKQTEATMGSIGFRPTPSIKDVPTIYNVSSAENLTVGAWGVFDINMSHSLSSWYPP